MYLVLSNQPHTKKRRLALFPSLFVRLREKSVRRFFEMLAKHINILRFETPIEMPLVVAQQWQYQGKLQALNIIKSMEKSDRAKPN